MERFSCTSDAELAEQITTWSGRIAAGEAELLTLVGEFDAREAWAGTGLLSCAHWLAWRTGLSPTAAREKVRVARALRELPQVQEGFAAGRLSYSQVRAVTRVATPEDEGRWVDAARSATGGQLERLVRGVRRVRRLEEAAADPELAAWRVRSTRSYDDDGNVVYRIVLPAEQAAVVDAALELARAELERRAAEDASAQAGQAAAGASAEAGQLVPLRESDCAPAAAAPAQEGASAEAVPAQAGSPSLAEVVVELARTALQAPTATVSAAARRAKAALTVQVDPLSGWGRLRDGELLPPTSLSAVLRTLPGRAAERLRPLSPADLRRHDLGRSQRLPSVALRELLGTLDGERCRFPGCTRHRRLHAHHVRYWSDGGTTDLSNIVLVCSRHHTLVHAQGFVMELRADRSLSVANAEGVPLLHHPAHPWRPAAELDPNGLVDGRTLPPEHVTGRIDLRYAVMVLGQQAA